MQTQILKKLLAETQNTVLQKKLQREIDKLEVHASTTEILSRQIDNYCINPDLIDSNNVCIAISEPVIGCNGVTYSNSCEASNVGLTSWTNQESGIIVNIEWDCNITPCTSWSGVVIYEQGFWMNPNDPCEAGECSSTGDFYGIAIDCAEDMGMPCNGEWLLEDGDCCSTCIETNALCTSWSGVVIYEPGFWTNPNDPCEAGECSSTGFYGIAIDCAEWMGMPCNGEWVLEEEGDCCSVCIETPPLNCEDISITLTDGWNMIGFACPENKEVEEVFSSIQDKIIIVKDTIGNAYLPNYNFNGIGDLKRGYGYLIKVSEEIPNYNICA